MKLKNICFISISTILGALLIAGCGLSVSKDNSEEELYIVTEDKNSVSLANSKLGNFGVDDEGNIYMENAYDGKIGYINKEGKKVIDFKYDEGSEFKYGMAGVKEKNNYKIINTKGKTIVKKEDGILYPLNKNLIKYEKLNEKLLINENKTETVKNLFEENESLKIDGILNLKGEVVVEPGRYDQILNDVGEGYILVKRGDKYGLLNPEGHEIIPCEYKGIGNVSEGFITVLKDNKFGAFNTKGELIIPIEYLYLGTMNEGVVPARLDESGIGFLDKEGNWAIMPYFDGVTRMNKGVAFARKEDRNMIIDKDGKEIEGKVEFENETSLNGFSDGGLAVVNIIDGESKYMSLINTRGEEIKGFEKKNYLGLIVNDNSLITTINEEKKRSLFKADGANLLKEEFDDIRVINEDVILTDKEGIYSYFNSEGKLIY